MGKFVKFQTQPYSIGLEVDGGQVLGIIAKGALLPVESRNIFTTVVNNQFAAEIHLLKGESGQLDGNRSLARILFPGMGREGGRRPRLEIIVRADMHGFVEVHIRDLATGVAKFALLTELTDQELCSRIPAGDKQELLESKVGNLMALLEGVAGAAGTGLDRALEQEVGEVLVLAREALASRHTGSLKACLVYLETLINELYVLRTGVVDNA